jgi:hypothetical protein
MKHTEIKQAKLAQGVVLGLGIFISNFVAPFALAQTVCEGAKLCQMLMSDRKTHSGFLAKVTANLDKCQGIKKGKRAVNTKAGNAAPYMESRLIHSQEPSEEASDVPSIFENQSGQKIMKPEQVDWAPEGSMFYAKPGSKCGLPFQFKEGVGKPGAVQNVRKYAQMESLKNCDSQRSDADKDISGENLTRAKDVGRVMVKCGTSLIWSQGNIDRTVNNCVPKLSVEYLKDPQNRDCFEEYTPFIKPTTSTTIPKTPGAVK